jgi:hypothetical protein
MDLFSSYIKYKKLNPDTEKKFPEFLQDVTKGLLQRSKS